MKHEKLIYGLGTTLIIVGVIMKILHLPYAVSILQFGIWGTLLFQTLYVTHLKKKIKELENKVVEQTHS